MILSNFVVCDDHILTTTANYIIINIYEYKLPLLWNTKRTFYYGYKNTF